MLRARYRQVIEANRSQPGSLQTTLSPRMNVGGASF
jgi:hypothetical protein